MSSSANGVAAGEGGANVTGSICGAEREIERAAVVADQDGRGPRRREIVAGLHLMKRLDPRRARPTPHRRCVHR